MTKWYKQNSGARINRRISRMKNISKLLSSPPQVKSEGTKIEACAPTIFHEKWWLDVSSDGNWDSVEISSGGQVVGKLPFQMTQAVISRIGMPTLTYTLGPAFETGKKFPNESRRQGMARDLIAGLPKSSVTSFRTSNVVDAMAFASAGFVCTLEYTCDIAPAPAEILWKNMRDKTRNLLRRAEESLTFVDQLSPGQFLEIYQANLSARSRENHYDHEVIRKLITETISRERGKIIATTDSAGNVQSAIFTAWDRNREYYLLSTRAKNSHNGAVSMVLWAAIRHAAERNLTFDFAGLHVHDAHVSNHLLFFGLGGHIRPVYRVKRLSLPLALAAAIKTYVAQRRSLRLMQGR